MSRRKYLTTAEFARATGIGRHMVAKLCASGVIRSVLVGARYAIPESELASDRFHQRRRPGRPAQKDEHRAPKQSVPAGTSPDGDATASSP
jgi:excisionase family DNA binding protein